MPSFVFRAFSPVKGALKARRLGRASPLDRAEGSEEVRARGATAGSVAPLPEHSAGRFADLIETAPKQAIKLRLDPDVLAYFREQGPGWQTRINATLRRAAGLKKAG